MIVVISGWKPTWNIVSAFTVTCTVLSFWSEETIVMRTEADVEEQAKALHGLQRVRDAKLEEERSRLRQEEEIFFTAAVVIGVILLISILLSFARRR